MPTYEFRCEACDHRGEYSAKVDDREKELPKVCPECQTPERIIKVFPTKTTFSLKGQGWAKDGY